MKKGSRRLLVFFHVCGDMGFLVAGNGERGACGSVCCCRVLYVA